MEQVQCVIDGVETLIEMEKKLENSQSIEDLIPSGKKMAAKEEKQVAQVKILQPCQECLAQTCFSG